MKKIVTLTVITFSLVLVSCNAKTEEKHVENKETQQKEIVEKIINLQGKTLEYNYGETLYQLSFNTDKDLHWKCILGDEKGREADETYEVQRLNDHTFFISWIESDGLGVSQVINLKDYKVNCYLKIDKDIIPLSGTIKEL